MAACTACTSSAPPHHLAGRFASQRPQRAHGHRVWKHLSSRIAVRWLTQARKHWYGFPTSSQYRLHVRIATKPPCEPLLAHDVAANHCAGQHHTSPLGRRRRPDRGTLSRSRRAAFHDRDERNDFTTSLQQRQRQELASVDRESYLQSRLSSSSGSSRTLNRAVRLDERGAGHRRSASVDSHHPRGDLPEYGQRPADFDKNASPHPALRISRRTKAAILFTLEEALRGPNLFTSDLDEEHAQMSDLATGRATNGGSRSEGPVPVSGGTPTGIRTPRDVMRDRNAREARRLEEQRAAEEQRQLAEERRRSAERRSATIAGGTQRNSQASSSNVAAVGAQQGAYDGSAGDRRSRGAGVAGTDALGDPVGRTTQEHPPSRARTASHDASRPGQANTSGTRRTQQSQSAPRQSGGTAQPPQNGAGNTASSFPHAFERWENLSSHWEGLTSYWLHKLEQNTEDIRNTIPTASTLNRQITDLSAAGANLFHAVVELQRLRASSERKFQRWFFETRADTERGQEHQAQIERELKLERSARQEAAQKRAEAEDAAALARREMAEMRRELMISKEEARRAWEELGRRNQESLETAQSLKDGRITVVAGVQVTPYFGGPSRTESMGHRPGTREGQQYYGSVAQASSAGAAGLQSPGAEQQYHREALSPTNTDPFTETASQSVSKPAVYPPYTTTTTTQNVSPAISRGPAPTSHPVSTAQAQSFYQQVPSNALVPSGQPGAASGSRSNPQREEFRSEPSYNDTLSEGDTEYAIDTSGNIRHDEHGRPIVFRPRATSDASDDFTREAVRHEQELATQYGRGAMPEAPSVPTTSSQDTTGAAATAGGPDYEGQGYGEWEAVQQTRHHHPTRLSDVLEEEEERSSRRTGE